MKTETVARLKRIYARKIEITRSERERRALRWLLDGLDTDLPWIEREIVGAREDLRRSEILSLMRARVSRDVAARPSEPSVRPRAAASPRSSLAA